MRDKKIFAVAVSVFILTFSIVIYFFVYKAGDKVDETGNQGSEIQDKMAVLSKLLPQVECSFGNNQEAYGKAIETSNINACECIKEEYLKKTCKNVAFDLNSYMEAIKQYNPDICNEIQDDSRKQACLAIVASGVEDLKKENPQQLADIYSRTHNDKAIAELEKLLEKNPTNVDNLISLALAYAEKGLKGQDQGKDQLPFVEKALQTIERAKTLEPDNSEVYRAEAYIYEIKPDMSGAIELYNKSIELDASNISAYAGRGHAENMLGILENALEDFKKAAQMDTKKENMFVYTNLCRLESSRADLLEEAIGNCKIVADSTSAGASSQSEAYQILATIYKSTKNYSQAENYLLKAKSLTPNDPSLYATLASLMIAQGKYPEAEVQARKAINLAPNRAASYQILAYALYKQEKNQEAIDTANEGLKLIDSDVSLLGPGRPAMKKDFYYTLANIYNRAGDQENETKYKQLGDDAFKN